MNPRIFVSKPAQITAEQEALWHGWARALADRHFVTDYLSRDLYSQDPWEQLRLTVGRADGVVVLGLRQLSVDSGVWRPGTPEEQSAPSYLTSAWMQLEAGLAVMAGLPVLVIAEAGVAEGVFDPQMWTGLVYGASLGAPVIDEAVRPWAVDVVAAVRHRDKGGRDVGGAATARGVFSSLGRERDDGDSV